MDYRPLEGFVFAVAPFNFTAIAGNLLDRAGDDGQHGGAGSRPRPRCYSAYYLMKLLEAAGLPPGVINFVPGSGAEIGDAALASPDLAGIHFTGSTGGVPGDVEDGRREHRAATTATRASSARPAARTSSSPTPRPTPRRVATAIVRGGFEYQGQKCSRRIARLRRRESLWPQIRERAGDDDADDPHGRRRATSATSWAR